MRRRSLFYNHTKPSEGIRSSDTKPCDFCLYNKESDKLLLVANSEFSKSLYPSSKYSPVGVVVVPGTHDVYGTGECAIINQCDFYMMTNFGTKIEVSKTYTGVLSISNHSSNPGQPLKLYTESINTVEVSLPSDGRTTTSVNPLSQSLSDKDTYYTSTGTTCAPSPYNNDDTRNSVYYQTTSPSSEENVLSDFNGKENTHYRLSARGDRDYSSWTPNTEDFNDFHIFSFCDMYQTEGTKQGDWYLPSVGEFGYLEVKRKKINTALSKLYKAYGVTTDEINNKYYVYERSSFSTSSPYVGRYLWSVETIHGIITPYNETDGSYEAFFIPFMRLKI